MKASAILVCTLLRVIDAMDHMVWSDGLNSPSVESQIDQAPHGLNNKSNPTGLTGLGEQKAPLLVQDPTLINRGGTLIAPDSQGDSVGAGPITPEPASAPAPDLAQETVTYEMLCAATDSYSVTRAGGNPPKPDLQVYEQYREIVAHDMSIQEQAMFLANVVWESVGLRFVEEIACRLGNCTYGRYFGRGYLQLTWETNYRDASHALYGDDRLVRQPELVAQPEGSWKTARYYWERWVRPLLQKHDAVDKHLLGYSVMAINGLIECQPGASEDNQRLRIYNEILFRWNIDRTRPGKMVGCLTDAGFLPHRVVPRTRRIAVTPTATPTGKVEYVDQVEHVLEFD